MVHDYDVCVIGGGPAGYAAAMRCWDFGKRVCLIERRRLGGAGLHDGALSSKTLWELSRDYRRAGARDRGYRCESMTIDYSEVARCVEGAIRTKEGQMRQQVEALGEPSSSGGSIQLVQGDATFVDPHRVTVTREGREPRTVRADSFIIATGSRPRLLPNIQVDGYRIITSDHVGAMDEFPRSLVILGAGVIGCEFATIFANYGKTEVHLLDRAERILPFEDEDISGVCARNLEARGVTIHHRARLESMRVVDDQVEYEISHAEGKRETIRVDHAIVSVGRVPNTEELGLEAAGLTLTDRGYIEDADTQTSVPHIYAVGDVTYDIALVSVAEIEGRHAAERICGGASRSLSYDNLSTIMFLDPEVAAIGMNEREARAKGICYRVARYNYALVNRAIAMHATDGFVKLLVTDDETMHILGMRALGVHASTSLEAVSLAIKGRLPVRELAELLHPHPAVTEGLQECVRVLLKSSIYKPHVFRSQLRASRVRYDDAGEPVETEL